MKKKWFSWFSFTNDTEKRRHSGFERSVTKHFRTVSSGILPALGRVAGTTTHTTNFRFHAIPRRFIIPPYHPRYELWQNFLIMLVFFAAWICPFEFGFPRARGGVLFVIDNIVNAFFAIDIGLTFFVAYLDKETYLFVDDPNKIALHYASRGFVLDLTSTIPYQLIYRVFTGNEWNNLIFSSLNMLRLWRLRRISQLFTRLEKDIRLSYVMIRCIKLSLVTLYVLHCSTCLVQFLAYKSRKTWLLESFPEIAKESVWSNYVVSLYWSLTIMSTVGYGDIYAANLKERIVCTLLMLLNLGLNAYIVGHISNIVVEASIRTFMFRGTIKEATEFIRKNRLPDALKEQMLAYSRLRFRTEELKQEELFRGLPKALRSNVAQELFLPTLRCCYLFNGVSRGTILHIVSEIKPEYFPPKVDVILKTEVSNEFYIVVFGSLDLIMNVRGKEKLIEKAEAPSVVGEIGVMCNIPQPLTARTRRLTQLLRINRRVFFDIMRANVSDARIIAANFLERLRRLEPSLLEKIQPFVDWSAETHGYTHKMPSQQRSTAENKNRGPDSSCYSELNARVEISKRVKVYWCDNPFVHFDKTISGFSEHKHLLGKILLVPETIQDLIIYAGAKLGKHATKLMSFEGSEILDVDVIRENDVLLLY